MSLSTDLTSLNNAIAAVVNDINPVLGEISASDVAVLSPLTTTAQTIQLGAGGDAVIETNFLKESFRVRVGGYAHIQNNPGQAFTVIVSLNGVTIATIDPNGNNTTSPFFVDILCFWQASLNKLTVIGSSYKNDTGGAYVTENQASYQSLSSSAHMDFKITAQSSASDSGAVTITEFRVLSF